MANLDTKDGERKKKWWKRRNLRWLLQSTTTSLFNSTQWLLFAESSKIFSMVYEDLVSPGPTLIHVNLFISIITPLSMCFIYQRGFKCSCSRYSAMNTLPLPTGFSKWPFCTDCMWNLKYKTDEQVRQNKTETDS